jgi:hypothetical protein
LDAERAFQLLWEIVSRLPGRPYRLTASELPLLNLTAPGSLRYLHLRLDEYGVAQDNVESIYPCTALQEGILFAQLKGGSNNHIYLNRFASRLTSNARLGSAQEVVDVIG